MVPVSSRPQECDLAPTSESFPFTWYLVGRCSNAFRMVGYVVVFKCPGWFMVVLDPSPYLKFIVLILPYGLLYIGGPDQAFPPIVFF